MGSFASFFWVDIRDMLTDSSVNGGIDRLLFRNVSDDCKCQSIRDALVHQHIVAGSVTTFPGNAG